MLSQSVLFVVCMICPPVTVASLTSMSRNYKKLDGPNQLAFYDAVFERLSVKSVSQCAVHCSGKSQCWGFKFHEGNRTCDIRLAIPEHLAGLGPVDFTSFTIIGKPKCPDQYIWNIELDFCYKIHDNGRELLDDAESICQAETDGGRLVVLDSAAKHDALVASIEANAPNENYYVGARRYSQSEPFRWSDGQLVDKIPWCDGQPIDENCGSMWAGEGFCMDDNACHERQRFVCEKYLG